jgi:hypothetical protein
VARFQHLKTQHNAFSEIRKISNCSKRIALRFQGLKTRRIAVDALLKRRVAMSLYALDVQSALYLSH